MHSHRHCGKFARQSITQKRAQHATFECVSAPSAMQVTVFEVAQALFHSIAHAAPGEVFNLVDDDPAPRSVVTEYASRLLSHADAPEVEHARPPQCPSPQPSAPVRAHCDAKSMDHATASAEDVSSKVLAGASPSAGRMRARGEKRVSNQKAKRMLGWKPQYPSYREGLAAILEQEDSRLPARADTAT